MEERINWRRGRVVDSTGLENRRSRKALGGSNPPVSDLISSLERLLFLPTFGIMGFGET